MSTFESFITTSGVEQDESFLSGLCSQHPKVEAFLAEYHRRAELVRVLHEQNALLKRQVDSAAAGNAQTRSSVDKLVEEAGWSLGKTQNDLVLVGQECAKMREFVRVLEANNDGLKQRSAENEMLIVEAKDKIEALRDRVHNTESEVREVEAETERVREETGCCRAVSATINRQLDTFEELAHDTDRLRDENKSLLDKISIIQMKTADAKKIAERSHEDRLENEERNLNLAVNLKRELELVRSMITSQERLINTVQIDLETLREENAYLTERAKKRNLPL